MVFEWWKNNTCFSSRTSKVRKSNFLTEFCCFPVLFNHRQRGQRRPFNSIRWERYSMLSSVCASSFTGFSRGVGGVTSMCTIVSACGNRVHSKQLTYKWTFRMPWLWILGLPRWCTGTKRASFLWAFWVYFLLDLFVLFPFKVILEWNIETSSTVMNRIPLSLCGTCCISVDCRLAQSRPLSNEQMDGWMNKWMNE